MKNISVSGSEISSRQVKLFPGLQILLASICYMYEDYSVLPRHQPAQHFEVKTQYIFKNTVVVCECCSLVTHQLQSGCMTPCDPSKPSKPLLPVKQKTKHHLLSLAALLNVASPYSLLHFSVHRVSTDLFQDFPDSQETNLSLIKQQER